MPSEYLATFSSARSARPTVLKLASTRRGPMRSMAPSRVRFSRAVIVGNIAGVSTIAPTRRITAGSPPGVGCPSTAVRPAVAATRPSRQRIVVVFPDPFGPRNPNTPPSGTDRSSPCTATFGAFRHRRYSLRSPSTSITAVMHRQTNLRPSRVTRAERTMSLSPATARRASVQSHGRPSRSVNDPRRVTMDSSADNAHQARHSGGGSGAVMLGGAAVNRVRTRRRRS